MDGSEGLGVWPWPQKYVCLLCIYRTPLPIHGSLLSLTPIQVTSANAQLKEGDVVTVRGKGRLEIAAVEKTSKDKYRVKMTKFA